MPIASGQINPLNALGIRKLSFIPPHFEKIVCLHLNRSQNIDQWIYTHLNSRYCVKKSYKLINNHLTEVCEIGIEDPQEISMLSLSCPYLI